MPWCPKCKMEYKEGVTICPDCNVELVEELTKEEVKLPVAGFEKEETAAKLVSFLISEDLNGSIEYSNEAEAFLVHVPKEQITQAKKCAQAFFQVEQESEPASKEKETEDPKPKSKPTISSPYVKRAEKSKDLKSSATTFFFFAAAILIFIILNLTNVITYLNNPFSYFIMICMFAAFLWFGISSLRMSKQAATEAIQEEEVTKKLNDWLKEHVTKELLDSFCDPLQSEEINFMRKMDGIGELLTKEFGEMNDSYLDSIIEDFYNETFESKP